MSVDSTPIRIDPDSEIGRRLRETASARRPLLVDIGDATYSVTAKAETTVPLSAPTAEEAAAAIAAITGVAGSWAGLIDADAFKAYLRERRKTANRPSVRL